MKKRYFAYSEHRSFSEAIRYYPDNPRKHAVPILDLGLLSEHQYQELHKCFSTHNSYDVSAILGIVSFDELNAQDQLLVKTKVRSWEELPSNVAINLNLRNVHKAASLLRGEKEKEDREVYYLYFIVNEGHNEYKVRSCVKVIGKIPAIAACSYAEQKVKHLLEQRKLSGWDDGLLCRTVANLCDCDGQDELDGVALATQARLDETEKSIDDDDIAMLCARSVVDFCQKHYPASLVLALEMNVAPPIFTAIKNGNESEIKPIPVYLVDSPRDATLDPKDCPVEGDGGFWVPQIDFAARVRTDTNTLTAYRKKGESVRLSSDGTWGIDKNGNTFKKIDPSKSNSRYLYWVRYK